MKVSAIIPAAGMGTRFKSSKNKLFEDLKGLPVIVHTLKTISSIEEINNITICASENLIKKISELVEKYEISGVKNIIPGGKTRQESVFNGLRSLDIDIKPDIILIHDGARPLVSADLIRNSLQTTIQKGASIAAVPAKDTIKKVNPETFEVIETPNRQTLWQVQTPQVFKFNDILKAHKDFAGENFTDDAALMEKSGYKVFVCMGSYKNIKITTEEDLKIAEVFIN